MLRLNAACGNLYIVRCVFKYYRSFSKESSRCVLMQHLKFIWVALIVFVCAKVAKQSLGSKTPDVVLISSLA